MKVMNASVCSRMCENRKPSSSVSVTLISASVMERCFISIEEQKDFQRNTVFLYKSLFQHFNSTLWKLLKLGCLVLFVILVYILLTFT